MKKHINCFELSRVIDSRYANGEVRRRRICPKCKTRFTTREVRQEELDVLRKAQAIPEDVVGLLLEAVGKIKGE